jgi:23S rRNA (pseudouridine1915-N3)-methyltransferase
MQLRVIAVGRMREGYLVAAADDFRRRLRPYHRLDEVEVRAADGGDPERAMQLEGEAILRLIAPADHVWLLERTGIEFSSDELAARFDALALEGTSRITFVIAGTYGASPALVARANVRWSLSRLTFLHEWARAIVLEQLYRAAKIAHDEPYHH